MTVLIILLAVAAYVGLGHLAQVYTDRQWCKQSHAVYFGDSHAPGEMRALCYVFPPAAFIATFFGLR